VRGEIDALRRVAHLASDYLELQASQLRDGVAGAATLHDLRTALDDLRARFPYTLEAPPGARARRGAEPQHSPAIRRIAEGHIRPEGTGSALRAASSSQAREAHSRFEPE